MSEHTEDQTIDVVYPDTDPKADPGYRLHVYREPFENTILAEEQVLPEKVRDPKANRVIASKRLTLKRDEVRWVRDQLTAVLEMIDREHAAEVEIDTANAIAAWIEGYEDEPINSQLAASAIREGRWKPGWKAPTSR